jgi:hypothetical protein
MSGGTGGGGGVGGGIGPADPHFQPAISAELYNGGAAAPKQSVPRRRDTSSVTTMTPPAVPSQTVRTVLDATVARSGAPTSVRSSAKGVSPAASITLPVAASAKDMATPAAVKATPAASHKDNAAPVKAAPVKSTSAAPAASQKDNAAPAKAKVQLQRNDAMYKEWTCEEVCAWVADVLHVQGIPSEADIVAAFRAEGIKGCVSMSISFRLFCCCVCKYTNTKTQGAGEEVSQLEMLCIQMCVCVKS